MNEKDTARECFEADIDVTASIVREAMYRRIYAVRCGIDSEVDPFPWSKDEDKRNKQLCWRWRNGAVPFAARRIPYQPAGIDRRILAPSLQRLHTLVTEPTLLRFVEIIDRLRTGILEIMVEPYFQGRFCSDESFEFCQELLTALANYDMKSLGQLLSRAHEISRSVTEVLALTTPELEAIGRLDTEEWSNLLEGEEPFGRLNLQITPGR